jgi:hypothetical protein
MQAKRKMQAPKNVFMFEDQYRDFLVFEPSKPDLLRLIINTVLQYNRTANLKGEQQLLLFYDKMITRMCAASKIQTNWRAHLMRRRFQRTEYPIKSIIRQRAALCIQRFWSDTKFRKRLLGLERIKNHVIQISSRVLYVEQSIYHNLKQIAKMIETQLRFEEQTLDFDFNQLNSQVCLFVNENHKYVQRY